MHSAASVITTELSHGVRWTIARCRGYNSEHNGNRLFKEKTKLVNDDFLLGNKNGNPSCLDVAQGNERKGQTRLLP